MTNDTFDMNGIDSEIKNLMENNVKDVVNILYGSGSVDPYIKALVFIYDNLNGVLDENGMDVVQHAKDVANKVDKYGRTEGARNSVKDSTVTVALLHDVLKFDSSGEIMDMIASEYGEDILNTVLFLTECENESDGEFMDRLTFSNNVDAMMVKMCEYEDKLEKFISHGNTESKIFKDMLGMYYDLRGYMEDEGYILVTKFKDIEFTYTLANHEQAIQCDVYKDIRGYSIAVNGVTMLHDQNLRDIIKSIEDTTVKWVMSFREAYLVLIFVRNLKEPSAMFTPKNDYQSILKAFGREIEFSTNDIRKYVSLRTLAKLRGY